MIEVSRLIPSIFLVAVAVGFAPSSHGASKAETYAAANKAYDEGRPSEAMDIYDIVISENPSDRNPLWWGSQAAWQVGDFERAEGYLVNLKKLDPRGLRPREKLIQV